MELGRGKQLADEVTITIKIIDSMASAMVRAHNEYLNRLHKEATAVMHGSKPPESPREASYEYFRAVMELKGLYSVAEKFTPEQVIEQAEEVVRKATERN